MGRCPDKMCLFFQMHCTHHSLLMMILEIKASYGWSLSAGQYGLNELRNIATAAFSTFAQQATQFRDGAVLLTAVNRAVPRLWLVPNTLPLDVKTKAQRAQNLPIHTSTLAACSTGGASHRMRADNWRELICMLNGVDIYLNLISLPHAAHCRLFVPKSY